MAEIKLSKISVDFPLQGAGHKTYEALKDINLKLTSGDRLGVLGPNGSGKTTLLRVITGIYPPSRGALLLSGSIGSMLDLQAGFNGKVSGRENILFRSRLLGRSKQLARETVEDACDFGGLAEFIDQPLETYSSGMKMRLAFSIATAVPADILVMDEWLSVGDSSFQDKARRRIESLLERAEILVLASHNEALLSKLCNNFLHLEKGVASQSGTV